MITQTRPRERAIPDSQGMEREGRVRRFAVPIAVTILVVTGGLLGPSALADGATMSGSVGARLEVGWGYLLMAPVANVLDTLSLLTMPQHYAVLATLILLYAGWRVVRSRRRLGVVRRIGVELGMALLSLVSLLAFYAYGALAPRPMAALVPEDEDVVVVDVHSHTFHSHDGRDGFSAEDNRAWHAGAGFDAVYVSDHRTYEGYQDAVPENPSRAGAGTVLLPALEIKFGDKYASALGEAWRYRPAMDGNTLIPDSLYRVYRSTGIRPTLVLTIPERVEGAPPSTEDSIGYVALELSDAAPRGLLQGRRDRAELLRMADSLDLAIVAATNNHGWGRTAAAWTLMRIPGWQAMSPAQLSAAIERTLHLERREAARVVERRVPFTESPVGLAATVPAITWSMFGGMSVPERISWLAWSWILAAALVLRRRRATTRAAAPRPPLASAAR